MTKDLNPKDTDCLLCVKVGKVKRESLYEMTRKYWVVNLERASKATHVLAIVNGIVDAVYIRFNGSIQMKDLVGVSF